MQSFNDNKAGMAGLDKERIGKIIEENTSSNFDEHAKKRNDRITTRIKQNRCLMDALSAQQIAKAQCQMDQLVEVLEKSRELSRIAVHVDMDAFYAAVEMRDDPSLRTVPMAVGSDSMLSTSNYAARRFGVRAAMPGFIARKLCPELKIIRCDFDKYRSASHEVRKVLEEYDSNFIMGSLDEAYLDITEYMLTRSAPVERLRVRYSGECVCRLPLIGEDQLENAQSIETSEETCRKCAKQRVSVQDVVQFDGSVDEVVKEMRFRVEQATGLTCSAGIAPNSMIAKVCSDMNKPNGQFRVANDRKTVLDFMRDLPIRKVSGIGAVTEAVLKGIGVERCGDLYDKRALLSLLFSQCSYEHFLHIALGISSSYSASISSEKESRRKSISNERTFHPTQNIKTLIEITEGLCEELIESLARRGIRGGYSATVKMKFSTFDTITRCTSVDYLIGETASLMQLCEKIINNELNGSIKQVRLLGVRLSRLVFLDDKMESTKCLASFWSKTDKPEVSNDVHSEGVNGHTANDTLEQPISVTSDEPSSSTAQYLAVDMPICPICALELPTELTAVNTHIDECLNRRAISELQDVDKGQTRSSESRKRSAIHKSSLPHKRSPQSAVKKQLTIQHYFTIKDP